MPSADLRERLGVLDDLGRAGSLLSWDQEVMMPPAGNAGRGEVMATIARLHHERLTDPALAEALVAAEGEEDPHLLRAVRHDVDRARRIPAELAAEMTRAAVTAMPAWMKAREESDYAAFAPFLSHNVELRRQLAACFPEAAHPYDALVDDYEPGMTVGRLRPLFAELREGLVPLIAEIAAAPAPPPLPAPFDRDAQRALGLEIARSFGFDDEAWRLDLSVHPFASGIGPGDVRVTGRFHEEDLGGVFAVMHEVGHGLYEAQVDPALARTTTGTGVSLGIHESQSRMWENLVGRSRPFWSHWLPRAQEVLPSLAALDLDAFVRAVNRVEPSLIRVEADEATYNLHIILRFELEVALLEGTLDVADLPEAWNAKTRELLGIEVPDDARGVLQDVHWAHGIIGYFPTYAIGNMVAAQLWRALRRDLPDLDASIAAGDCAPLRTWLGENVHRHGRLLEPAEVLREATGEELSVAPLLEQLSTKYRALYGLT